MSATMINMTVGQLVADKPRRSKVFEQFGIDYCCGGKKPLHQACAETGVGAPEVISAIEALDTRDRADDISWSHLGVSGLADHIEQIHHAYLREALPRLSGLAAKVASAHGAKRPQMIELANVFEGLREELEAHMMKEEMVLFPMLRQLESATELPSFHCGSVRNPVHMMEHEHDSAGAALRKMRALADDYSVPDDVCNTYRALMDGLLELEKDLHEHIHKENNILFPKGVQLELDLYSR